MKSIHSRSCRRGVTLVEVMFAIGVVLVGLVGIVSILPLAGRRSRDAVSLSVGSAYADSVRKLLLANQYYSSGRLFTLASCRTFNSSSSVGTAPASFCIDPLFSADYCEKNSVQVDVTGFTLPPSPANFFQPQVFPHYKVDYDPTLDPRTSPTAAATGLVRPIMMRVGIKHDQLSPGSSISIEEAFRVADSPDDIAFERPADRTKPAYRTGLSVASGTSQFGRHAPSGEFTWLATVSLLPGNEYASVAIVVLRNRDRTFEVPSAVGTTSVASSNPLDERLAYVTYFSGFNGGAGGTVHLVASSLVPSAVQTNDWIMLSRTSAGVATHHWYRVSAVDGDPEVESRPIGADSTVGSPRAALPSTSNPTTRNVWTRKVYLDGPDWAFGFSAGMPQGYADSTFADNTFATIVRNVVAVSEHVIPLSSL